MPYDDLAEGLWEIEADSAASICTEDLRVEFG